MLYSKTPVVYRDVRIQHNHSAAFGFVASALSLEPIVIHCNSDLSYSLHKRLVTWSPVSPLEPGIPALPCKTKIGNNISNQLRLHHCCCFFRRSYDEKPPVRRDLDTPRAYVPFSLAAGQWPLNIQKNSNKNSELDFNLENLFTCPLSLPSAWSWAAFWSL